MKPGRQAGPHWHFAAELPERVRISARAFFCRSFSADRRGGENPMQFINAGFAFLIFLVILWLLLDPSPGP
jgi:hypothetical protein